ACGTTHTRPVPAGPNARSSSGTLPSSSSACAKANACRCAFCPRTSPTWLCSWLPTLVQNARARISSSMPAGAEQILRSLSSAGPRRGGTLAGLSLNAMSLLHGRFRSQINSSGVSMKTIKGPALFLAQFAGDKAPYNAWDNITKWAASLGYKGVQIPTWDARLFDLEVAAESKTYCDEIRGVAQQYGLVITELSTHLQGQLVAVHPAYDIAFDGFAPKSVHGTSKARQDWAVQQLRRAAKASANLGLYPHATFSGALAWPYLYPWPQRPAGLVETAFDELAKRWKPILDAFDKVGVDVAFEIHPGEDLHDGATFEMF